MMVENMHMCSGTTIYHVVDCSRNWSDRFIAGVDPSFSMAFNIRLCMAENSHTRTRTQDLMKINQQVYYISHLRLRKLIPEIYESAGCADQSQMQFLDSA